MKRLEILGIVGSLRKDSYNRATLKAAQELMPVSASLALFELQDIPLYNQDTEAALPPSVAEFKRRILAADGILFATPEYNYSVPSVLKNAVDWASRPFGKSAWLGKPAAIVGASPGNMGSARAQYHLRQILVSLDMPVVNLPEVMISNAPQFFDAQGKLHDEPARARIRKLLDALIQLINVTQAGVAAGVSAEKTAVA